MKSYARGRTASLPVDGELFYKGELHADNTWFYVNTVMSTKAGHKHMKLQKPKALHFLSINKPVSLTTEQHCVSM